MKRRYRRAPIVPLTDAQRRFAEDNVKLLYKLSNMYARLYDGLIEADDCRQIAALGYIRAIQSYNKEAGKLGAYVALCIGAEIRRYIAGMYCGKRGMNKTVYEADAGFDIMRSEFDTEETAIRNIEAQRMIDTILQRYPQNRRFIELLLSGMEVKEAAAIMHRSTRSMYNRISTMRNRCRDLAYERGS